MNVLWTITKFRGHLAQGPDLFWPIFGYMLVVNFGKISLCFRMNILSHPVLVVEINKIFGYKPIEYWNVMSSNFLLCISRFSWPYFSVDHDENPRPSNLTWIGSWWPEMWLHEYLISPLKSVFIGLVHDCLEPGQFTLISVGLISYLCGHILGPHEPIPTKFGLWMFLLMLHQYMVSKMKKKKIFFVMSSLLCSIEAVSLFLQ